MFFWKKKETFKTDERLDSVAIIMDGNGRWAKRRMLPRTLGHKAGADNVEKVLRFFREIGVHYVTLYAFSTENWKRPKEEVDALMEIIYRYVDEVAIPRIRDNLNFCVRFVGDISVLPEKLYLKCKEAESMASGRPFVCNIALNYGGRDEIVNAVNTAVRDGVTTFTHDDISSRLYTAHTPDPDLMIRTGGEMRVSNFLLWQSAYTEFYYTKTLWPDFGKDDIMKAVRAFYGRNRRFGGLDREEGESEA